jgi:5-methyltetrahydropteroyltriglutamate--homocysteine methyltransferase
MKTSTERILTTHVGSLPRPDSLVEMLLARDRRDPFDAAALTNAVKAAVEDVVARQVRTGVDVVSDGEAGKAGYSTYVKERLAGFSEADYLARPQTDLNDFPGLFEMTMGRMGIKAPGGRQRRLCCTSPVARVDNQSTQVDIANLKAALNKTPATDAFMNAVSPGTVAHFQPNRHYPSMSDYFEAVALAMRPEYEAIVASGLVLQVDSPDLAMSHHSTFQDLSVPDFLAQAELAVEALNHALVNVPASSVRLHVCWGNYEGPHHHDMPLETVLPVILKAKAQAISFEGSNPRHAHEWKVWADRRVPADKVLLPGMLDTSTNFVEHPELVAQRIEQYVSVVGRERVIASTDCGFATFAGQGKIHPGVAFKKLESLVEGARIASKRLWS